MLDNAIKSGAALEKFKELIQSQGGDDSVIDDYSKFKQPAFKYELKSEFDGFVKNIDAYKIAYACKLLGAGREKKSDSIDFSAGVELRKIYGEKVEKGGVLAVLYSDSEEKLENALQGVRSAFDFCPDKPAHRTMVYKII